MKCTHGNNPHLCFLLFSLPPLAPLSLPVASFFSEFFQVRVRYKHVKSWVSTKYAKDQHKYPAWTERDNNTFTLAFDHQKNAGMAKPILVVDCWDNNTFIDDVIGEGQLDLTRILSSQPGSATWREYKVDLLYKGRSAGDIYVDMKYVTTSSVAEDHARRGEAQVHLDQAMAQTGTKDMAALLEHEKGKQVKQGETGLKQGETG